MPLFEPDHGWKPFTLRLPVFPPFELRSDANMSSPSVTRPIQSSVFVLSMLMWHKVEHRVLALLGEMRSDPIAVAIRRKAQSLVRTPDQSHGALAGKGVSAAMHSLHFFQVGPPASWEICTEPQLRSDFSPFLEIAQSVERFERVRTFYAGVKFRGLRQRYKRYQPQILYLSTLQSFTQHPRSSKSSRHGHRRLVHHYFMRR